MRETPDVRRFPPSRRVSYKRCWLCRRIIWKYLKKKRLDAYNQRVFKQTENGQTSYEIRFASQQPSTEPDTTVEKLLNLDEIRNGIQFRVRRGDYSNVSKIPRSRFFRHLRSEYGDERRISRLLAICIRSYCIRSHVAVDQDFSSLVSFRRQQKLAIGSKRGRERQPAEHAERICQIFHDRLAWCSQARKSFLGKR